MVMSVTIINGLLPLGGINVRSMSHFYKHEANSLRYVGHRQTKTNECVKVITKV